jgi:hypothetical protein
LDRALGLGLIEQEREFGAHLAGGGHDSHDRLLP